MATFMPKIPPESPPLPSQYTSLIRHLATTVVPPDNVGDAFFPRQDNAFETNNKNKNTTKNNDPSDDNDNNTHNVVDCFPRQDKQSVLPQDTSTDNLPSLIESPTDKSTDTTDTNNNAP
tara:strand:+ start:250 stop:606 length:357 start_codon:yes stop_codon:yes gene_type:complete